MILTVLDDPYLSHSVLLLIFLILLFQAFLQLQEDVQFSWVDVVSIFFLISLR